MTEIIQSDREAAEAMLSDLCAPMTDLAGEAAAAHFAAYRRALYEPTPERVKEISRIQAKVFAGIRSDEFDSHFEKCRGYYEEFAKAVLAALGGGK